MLNSFGHPILCSCWYAVAHHTINRLSAIQVLFRGNKRRLLQFYCYCHGRDRNKEILVPIAGFKPTLLALPKLGFYLSSSNAITLSMSISFFLCGTLPDSSVHSTTLSCAEIIYYLVSSQEQCILDYSQSSFKWYHCCLTTQCILGYSWHRYIISGQVSHGIFIVLLHWVIRPPAP